jgi:hypothetical protein
VIIKIGKEKSSRGRDRSWTCQTIPCLKNGFGNQWNIYIIIKHNKFKVKNRFLKSKIKTKQMKLNV